MYLFLCFLLQTSTQPKVLQSSIASFLPSHLSCKVFSSISENLQQSMYVIIIHCHCYNPYFSAGVGFANRASRAASDVTIAHHARDQSAEGGEFVLREAVRPQQIVRSFQTANLCKSYSLPSVVAGSCRASSPLTTSSRRR